MVWERIAVHTPEMRHAYPMVVAIALAVLTALMLFATPVVAGDLEDGVVGANAGNFQKAFRLYEPLAERHSYGWFPKIKRLEGKLWKQ